MVYQGVFLKPADSGSDKNGNEVDKSGKRLGRFLIVSRKASELLHPIEEPLRKIAAFVHVCCTVSVHHISQYTGL